MSTVSKVLNGRGGVSPATRAVVEELLDRHGYLPRGDRGTSAAFIDVVFSELDSAWAVELIRGVGLVAREHGLSVVLTESGDRSQPGDGWVEGVLRRRPVGVVLVLSDLPSSARRQLDTRGIPFVVIDPTGDPAPDVAAIGATNFQGGVTATRHLLELGHTRIGVISGPDSLSVRARVAGYTSALQSAGVETDASLIMPGDYQIRSGFRGGVALLSRKDPVTAIFAVNDLQAFGVYEAARSLGLTIPDDVSVVGFDDIPAANWAGPPLTTIRQPLTEMAEEATRLVIRLRNQEPPSQLRVELATSLITRASTAPVRPS